MVFPIESVPVIVRSLLASRGADVSNLRNNRIIALIDSALETMAYRVARGDDYRGLQREFEGLTPAVGELDLGTLGNTIIFNLVRAQVKEDSTGALLTPVDSLHTLHYGNLPVGQVYYAQDGMILRFRNSAGALDTYALDVTITANFIPSFSQIPSEYEGLFINTLAGLLTTSQPEMRAQELAEVGRA